MPFREELFLSDIRYCQRLYDDGRHWFIGLYPLSPSLSRPKPTHTPRFYLVCSASLNLGTWAQSFIFCLSGCSLSPVITLFLDSICFFLANCFFLGKMSLSWFQLPWQNCHSLGGWNFWVVFFTGRKLYVQPRPGCQWQWLWVWGEVPLFKLHSFSFESSESTSPNHSNTPECFFCSFPQKRWTYLLMQFFSKNCSNLDLIL